MTPRENMNHEGNLENPLINVNANESEETKAKKAAIEYAAHQILEEAGLAA